MRSKRSLVEQLVQAELASRGPRPASCKPRLDDVTVATIRRLSGGDVGKRLGIREVALAVEEAMSCEVPLSDIHEAVNRLAHFRPSNDPRDPAARRQRGFRMAAGNDEQDARVWVYYRPS